MHSFFILALISVQWVLWGYTWPSADAWTWHTAGWSSASRAWPRSRTPTPATISLAFMIYQVMFAIITPALITGAFAERKRFRRSSCSACCGPPSCTPRGSLGMGARGWLRELGALDFAGGTVVHITSGVSALVAAMILGQRAGSAASSSTTTTPP